MLVNPFDLHCHSWFSDGTLAPSEVVNRAAENGVECLALTDHDSTAGLEEALHTAHQKNIRLIPGIELSVSWRNGTTLHILGLNIQKDTPELQHVIEKLKNVRLHRAHAMAHDLKRVGIHDAWEGALRQAKAPELLTRTHFARFLVERGSAPSISKVYKHYLAQGKPGFCKSEWLSLEESLSAIHAAQGLAVIAHPGRYSLSNGAMQRLLDSFKALGGQGLEVVTSNHTPDQTQYFTQQCFSFGFRASCGSDFHCPKESRIDLGRIHGLPVGLTPIWADWDVTLGQ